MANELYNNVPEKVVDLLNNIRSGRLGLPDLQRPFVWRDAKVRDLFDSMFKGYPIGYVMIWSAPEDYNNVRHIGTNDKAYKQSEDLVIDGQQRLTSLLGAMFGIPVKDKNFKERHIRIVFNPLESKFDVWSNQFDKNPEWINDISKAFEADERHEVAKFRKDIIKRINASREEKELELLTDDEEEIIENNLKLLLDLKLYTIPVLRIRQTADEEDVADIFKRVNSGGQNLNENNFIETLLSVYDNEVHNKIIKFCSDSRVAQDGTSYNLIINAEPTHLIRMAIGYGFSRARMRYGYKLMRGKDLKSGETSEEIRNQNLQLFKESLEVVTNLNDWHAYLNLFARAGYQRGSIVSSTYVVTYGYVWYLLGKYKYNVKPIVLQQLITRFIFMALVAQYYATSPESSVEKNFADLRDLHSADEFVAYFDNEIRVNFTDDFFSMTLPSTLQSSSAISPSWYAYIASLNVLGTNMLFSTTPQSAMWQVGTSGKKKSIDKHHIFPKHYLTQQGYQSDRERNQIANFTYIDYNTNIEIGDDAPADYVNKFRERLGEEGYLQTCAANALPENFETLSYPEFLAQRRILMAGIIKKAYLKLSE